MNLAHDEANSMALLQCYACIIEHPDECALPRTQKQSIVFQPFSCTVCGLGLFSIDFMEWLGG